MDTTATGPALPILSRDRRVLGWAAAEGVSETGDQIWFIALAYTAAQLGDPALAGLIIAATTLPRALLLLIGGAATDRIDAHRLMLLAHLVRVVVLAGGLLVLALTGTSIALLLVVGLLFGAADSFYGPASAAFSRQLRPRAELAQLAGIRQLVTRGAVLGGPPLGGLVFAAFGLAGAMLLDLVSFLVIAAVLLVVRPRWPLAKTPARSLLSDVREGVAYLARTPRVRDLVIALSGLNIFVTPITAVGLALRVTAEDWGPVALGLLTATLGAGAIIGTVVILRVTLRRPVLVALSTLVAQAVGLGLVGSAPLPVVYGAMALVGLTAGLASPLLAGAFQATVDETHIGRTGSLLNISDDALLPLAIAGFGLLAAGVGLAIACGVYAAGFLVLLGYTLSRRHVRAMRADGTVT